MTYNKSLFEQFLKEFEKYNDEEKLTCLLKFESYFLNKIEFEPWNDYGADGSTSYSPKFFKIQGVFYELLTPMEFLSDKDKSNWHIIRKEIFIKYPFIESRFTVEFPIFIIGLKLRSLRISRMLSVNDLSDRVGLSTHTIKMMENDGRTCTLSSISKYVHRGLQGTLNIKIESL